MQKIKIATLEVFITDSREIPSNLRRIAPQQFELEVNPLVDEKVLEAFKADGKIAGQTLDLMQNIIAHELGHFVAFMTKCPTHTLDKQTLRAITVNGESGMQVVNPQAEIRAWTLAGTMLGEKLNKQLRDCTTASYLTGVPVNI